MEEFLGSTHWVTPAGKRRPAGSHVPPRVNPRVYLLTKTNHSTYLGCKMFHSLPVFLKFGPKHAKSISHKRTSCLQVIAVSILVHFLFAVFLLIVFF